MRLTPTWIGISTAVVCLLLFPLFKDQVAGVVRPDTIELPPLTDAFRVTYRPQHSQGIIEFWSEGLSESPATGPFDENGRCLQVHERGVGSFVRVFCLEPTSGSIATFDVLIPGSASLGRQAPGRVAAFTAYVKELAGPLLAGHRLTQGETQVAFLNGARLEITATEVHGGFATIDIVFRTYELAPQAVDGTEPLAWDQQVYAYRLQFDGKHGPFPNAVYSVQRNGAGPAILEWVLDSAEMRGKRLPATTWQAVGPTCGECRFEPFTGAPPASPFDSMWSLAEALEYAVQDPDIRAFQGRHADVVVLKAVYKRSIERQAIVGPLGTDAIAETWQITLVDPANGEALSFTARQSGNDMNVTEKDRANSSYHLPKAAWPTRLADPATAWNRILAKEPGAHIERLGFNERPDEEFFGTDPFVPVNDPDTREGMPPDLLPWTIVVAYPDGGASTFEFSAANGQWLLVGGRY